MYYLVWQDSTLNGWSYVTAIPARYIVSLLFGDHVLLFAVVFVLAIAFATVGAALAVRYYMPIQNLAWLLSDDTDQPQRVHDSVSRILRNNEDMRMELEETQGYLVQELLAQLIWGGANREETSSRLRRFGLALNGPVHAALTVSLGGASPHDTEAAIAALQDEGMLVTEAHDGGQIVLL